jgi:S-adenosylmethionine decarboxylase
MVSLAVCAAFVPAAPAVRPSWIERLLDRFSRRRSVATPPRVHSDTGWTLIQCEDPETFAEWLGRDAEGLPFKPGEGQSLGSHLLVEFLDCDQDALMREADVGRAMLVAAERSEATVVAESFHEFKPFGVSGAVIIQESHYTIHTWPEFGYAAVDLFYCGGTVHVNKAVEVLRERLKPGRMKFLVVRRGMRSEVRHLGPPAS